MTRPEVIQRLYDLIQEKYGTQYALADAIGITPAYLSEIMRNTRNPARKVLEFLNLREETIYVPKR